jgi:tryptophanyl-tRNA synthetase
MSLRDGTKKMSKSDPSDYSRIMLSDDEDEIVQKIRKAKTDPFPLPSNMGEAEKRPEALNLLTIFAALSETKTDVVVDQYAGKEFAMFKKDLADLTSAKITPIAVEMEKLMNDATYLDSIMKMGKEKAIGIAEPVLDQVHDLVGFSR